MSRLPKLELHHRYSYWNSWFIGIDRVGVAPKRHRILQQRQQWLRLFSTSLFRSYSNNGNHQDTTPLSALSNETNNTRQGVVISSSSFDNIRTNNCLYVDKTQHIYDTILKERGEKYFFFVRPRRFGKSLLCSTLANLFLGKAKEELFKGLWIHDSKVWDFEKEEHPVLHLDMSKVTVTNSNAANFETLVKGMLNNIASVKKIQFTADETVNISMFFQTLILRMQQKANKPVVLIIDEYDKPVLDLLDSPEQMETVRKSLQSFYSVLKSEESNIRMVFLTGLYRFTELSMFSTLNNLLDISFEVSAGSVVGYTESEIQTYFCHHIKALKAKRNIQDDEDVMNRLREMYNGYRFGLDIDDEEVSEPIYNPFAINHVFRSLTFKDNWCLSGSASMLSNKLVAAGDHYTSMLRIPFDKLETSYKPSDLSLSSLMYYGGYATIDSYDKASKEVILKVPNSSVEKHLAKSYLASIFSRTELTSFDAIIQDVCDLLNLTPVAAMESKIKEVEEKLDVLLNYYSYDALRNEASFQLIIDTIFKTRFTHVKFEYMTKDGRVDAAVFSDSRVLVIEYKYNKSSAEALQQIHLKKYYNASAILESRRPILLLGINLKIDTSKNKSVEIAYELHRDRSG